MIMMLYTVLKMKLEYIVKSATNDASNDFVKTILNHKLSLITLIKDNK